MQIIFFDLLTEFLFEDLLKIKFTLLQLHFEKFHLYSSFFTFTF